MAHLILLNQVAQGVRPIEALRSEVAGLSDESRKLFLADVAAIVQQAHPCPDDVAAAIERASLRATFTSCVLVTKKPLLEAMARMRPLPRSEDEKTICLLLALFQIADARRRVACGDSCTHWWHRDLRSKENVRSALESGG